MAAVVAAAVVAGACAEESGSDPGAAEPPSSYAGSVKDARDARVAARDIKEVSSRVDGSRWSVRVSFYGRLTRRWSATLRASLFETDAEGKCTGDLAIVSTRTNPATTGAGGAYSAPDGGGDQDMTTITRETAADRRSVTIIFENPRLTHRDACGLGWTSLTHFHKRFDYADEFDLAPEAE